MAGRVLPEFELLTVTSGLRMNPLTLNEVLEAIFVHLSVPDLKSVRLVSNSSMWQTTSTTALLFNSSIRVPRAPAETMDDRIKITAALSRLLKKCPSPRPLFSLHLSHPEEFVFYLTIDALLNQVSHLKYEASGTTDAGSSDADSDSDSDSDLDSESNMKSLANILQYFPNISQLTLTTDFVDFSLSPCPASMRKVQRREKGHVQLLEKLDELQQIKLLYPLELSAVRSFMDPGILHQLHAISYLQLGGTPETLNWLLQEFTKSSGSWKWNVEKIDLSLEGGSGGPDVFTMREFFLQFTSTLKQLHLNFKKGHEVGHQGPAVGPRGYQVGDDDDDAMDAEGQAVGPEAGPEGHVVGQEGHEDHHQDAKDAAAVALGMKSQHWRKDDWLLPQGLVNLSTLKITLESNSGQNVEPKLARTLIAALSLPALIHLELVTSSQCQMSKLQKLIFEMGRRCKFLHLGLESTWANSNCYDWVVQSRSLEELTIRHFGPIDQISRQVAPPPSFLPSYLWPNLSSVTVEMKTEDWGDGVYILNIFAHYNKIQKLHLIFNIPSDWTWQERKYERKFVALDDFVKGMKEITSKPKFGKFGKLGKEDVEKLILHDKRQNEEVERLETQGSVLDSLLNGENEYDYRSEAFRSISKSSSSSGSGFTSSSDFNLNSNLVSNLKQLSLSRSLRNLKELAHLTIENLADPPLTPFMTDFVIYRLLLEMNLKNLQSLEICGHGFSEDAVKDLKLFLGHFVSVKV